MVSSHYVLDLKKGRDMVSKAVIIAAGRGSRLDGRYRDVPKPLVPIAGVGLLKRTILTAKRAGINEFTMQILNPLPAKLF